MGSYNSVLLKRQFEVAMSIEAMTKIIALYKPSDYSIAPLGNDIYKVRANVSFGVGTGFFFNHIKIYASLKSEGPTQTMITLKSRLRFELYMMGIVSIILTIIVFSNSLPLWSLLLGPICLLWFWAVYRYQENNLADDFGAYLAKQPRMGWTDLK